jgi:hypothetical protein
MTNEQIIESLKSGEKTVSQIEDELTEEARRQELKDMKESIRWIRGFYDNHSRNDCNYRNEQKNLNIIISIIQLITLALTIIALIRTFQ